LLIVICFRTSVANMAFRLAWVFLTIKNNDIGIIKRKSISICKKNII